MDADCEGLPRTRRFSSILALLLGVLLADTLGCQYSLENALLKETGNPKSCPLSGCFISNDYSMLGVKVKPLVPIQRYL